MSGEVPMVFDLPTGWVDPQGALQKRIEIREMSGWEEDLIGDDRYPYTVRINKILSGCTTKVGSVTDKAQLEKIMEELTSVDRMKLLIMVRCSSVEDGPMLTFEAACPKCKKKQLRQVDLTSLKFESPKDPIVREYSVDLPSKRKAICRILTGAQESRIENVSKADLMSGSIVLRLVSIDGKPVNTVDEVKALPLRDRKVLRDKFDEMEGGFERNIEVDCGVCKTAFESRLDLGLMDLFYKDLKVS